MVLSAIEPERTILERNGSIENLFLGRFLEKRIRKVFELNGGAPGAGEGGGGGNGVKSDGRGRPPPSLSKE